MTRLPSVPAWRPWRVVEGWPGRLRRAVLWLAFGTPAYRLLLRGRGAEALLTVPPDPWPGNGVFGGAIVNGVFALAGETVAVDGEDPGAVWDIEDASLAWQEALHGFGWLGELRAAGGDKARRRARDLVATWIDRFDEWDPIAWQPDVLGQRLAAWIGQHEFFCASAEAEFRDDVFRSLARQARHLTRALALETRPLPGLAAAKGLVYAGVSLPRAAGGGERRVALGLRRLRREIERQVRFDGCHVGRCPSSHLAALRQLIDVRGALAAGGRAIPTSLQEAIDVMAPALRQMRHGDGGLALFNGANEEEGWIVDMVLAQASAPAKPRRPRDRRNAAIGGFQRLSAGRVLLLVDAGAPPPAGFDERAHAGSLSFEMSLGKERLVVNTGAAGSGNAEWAQAQRATAAHSTLIVADTNSAELIPAEDFGGGFAGGGLGRQPQQVPCTREDADGNTWIDASHDGYLPAFGLVHRRRIYLAASGDDVRGEDSLEGPGAQPYAIRFHLHPEVQAELAQSGASVLLRLPGGGGWRFRAGAGQLALEDSAYLGVRGHARRSKQIVVRAHGATDGSVIKWALKRESKR